ncbi:branched-chain amino acid transaminase [Romboutsia sp.]|uniref:branched-chain amino acid transaminase n=1 Tax=Romboutsia sp. TaxID=1965302 RepID=UPI002CBE5934|nr:branched-chain amino acid transaminase [Romboutsia sp.]HSQ89970.1 branched-chain amino acid transaminase [Romboutsia sp.]
MSSYVYYQGQVVDEKEVSISIRCKAFNYGLGCFEGIRAYWDDEEKELYVFRMREHYERLLNSCKSLYINIPYTVDELCEATIELLKKNNFKTTVYIRPVAFKGSQALYPSLYDDDNRILIYCQPLGKLVEKDDFKVKVTSWRRIEDNAIPARTKPTGGYLNSALASLEVLQDGYDEAIFLTEAGNVCEGPGENIFVYKNSKLLTPPANDNILEGITRDTVIKLARDMGIEVEERSIARSELYSADELFFCGTAMEVAPISYVDKRKIGDGEFKVCKAIKKAFFGLATGKNDKYSEFCTPVYEKVEV